jgi:hypothetical protein
MASNTLQTQSMAANSPKSASACCDGTSLGFAYGFSSDFAITVSRDMSPSAKLLNYTPTPLQEKKVTPANKRGKKFKTCTKCGLMAASNRQSECKHCKFDTKWSEPVKKTSSSSKKRKSEGASKGDFKKKKKSSAYPPFGGLFLEHQREAELNRREAELNQREAELNQREASVMAPEMSEAELFDPLQGDSLQGVFELNQREASVMAPEMSEAELFDSLQGDSLQGVFDIDM